MSTKNIVIIVVVVIVLGIAYYGLSPLLRNVEVDDPLPEGIENNSQAAATVSSGFEDLSPEDQEEMTKQMEEVNAEGPIAMDDEMPVTMAKAKADGVGSPDASEEASREEVATPTLAQVMGTRGHPASGTARVIATANGDVVRLEDFKTINGPRLHVYLAKDLEANEFIDLGPIKGTEGNINYEVPEGVDLSEYRYIMHWCVPFGVLFNYAEVG